MRTTKKRRWACPLLMALLFVGGLIPRLVALDWGLPYVEHFDEPALIQTVMQMVHDGDPNPHTFLYPSLMFYLLAATARLHAWWGIRQGIYTSIQDLPIHTYGFTVAPGLYVWSRAVTAILSASTVPAVYLLGLRMFDRRVGLLGALLVTVATFHVSHSHFITTDAPTGLWVVLAVLGAWRIVTAGDWRGYLLGGVATGLAAGTKYNAAAVALAVVAAHLFRWGRGSFGRPFLLLIGSGIAASGAFLVTTPYALLDWNAFIRGLRFNAAHYAEGTHGDFIGRWQLGEYASYLWTDGLRELGSVIALAGLPVLLWRFPRQTSVLLLVVVSEMLLLMSQAVNFVRNVLPVFPLMLLIAAAGAVALADLLRRPVPAFRHIVLLLLAVALLGPQVHWTAWLLRYWSRPHTMVAAAEKLRSLPRGMRAAVETNPTFWEGDPIVFPSAQLAEHPLDWYRANGFRYLIANRDFYLSPEERAIYEQMLATASVLLRLPERKAAIQLGPGGAVLDLGEHTEMMPFVRREMRFGEEVALLGYELQPGEPRSQITPLGGADTRELGSGQPLQMNLYWRALADMDRNYTLFIHVVDQQGLNVTQRDLPLRYGDYETSRWQRGELVIDRGDLGMPALPPGEYMLSIGLYDAESGAGLATYDSADGVQPGVLASITIR